MIREKCRSYVVFTKEIRGKDNSGWVTEWGRGSNYPSPEEAAHICIFLNTTPDDILLHEGKTPEETEKCLKDIETVRKLVEAEGAKKALDPKIEGLSADELRNLVQKTNDRDVLLMVLDEVNKKLQELR
jgi:hypothetical protein